MLANLAFTLVLWGTSAQAETLRTLPVGGSDVLIKPRPDASLDWSQCPDDVAGIWDVPGDSGKIEVRGVGTGTCDLVLDGRSYTYRIFDPGSRDPAICDAAKALVRRSTVTVRCSGDYVEFSGFSTDSFLRWQIEQFAGANSGIRVALQEVPREMVEFSVTFLETRATRSHDVGLAWSDMLPSALGGVTETLGTGGALGFGNLTPIVAGIKAESIVANFAIFETAEGLAVVGEDKQFTWGGTAYQPVTGPMTADLREIGYGLNGTLRFVPVAGGYEVHTDLSLNGQVPGETAGLEQATRGEKGVATITAGETIVVLNGVSNRSWQRKRGLPLLHRIPFLSWIFGTHEKLDAPVHYAVLLTVREPGDPPPFWLRRLVELKAEFGEILR